ncbi:30S ribosomal protein S20 [Chitinivibrio alkaliphilus]|uniref:Small ribosomal subunit protein bS20 n=1 Tax=Chitinivibrio alkaliphilus ACht1 TaxID=1313304 RepID=U7DCF1_9BACT|nr:30S ribosomal protein S20 [Chitinivibrio alkaliphilus]ERP32105.1 30S ribosomal protein S20 [Chitinivibrio alkaliphilus ACht1]
MPQHKSCKKRMKVSAKARVRNRAVRSEVKTAAKRVKRAESVEDAKRALVTAYSVLDKAVKRNVIHRNKANTQKSKLSKAVARIEA